MDKLKGQVAIVTGASGGIGRATARLFAMEGARVVIAARRSEKIGSVAGEIVKEGGECMAVPTDVSKRQQVEHLVRATLDRYGRIDILLNNAGILPPPRRWLRWKRPNGIRFLRSIPRASTTRCALSGRLWPGKAAG